MRVSELSIWLLLAVVVVVGQTGAAAAVVQAGC